MNRMTRVKVIMESGYEALATSINNWIKEENSLTVVDIKYSTHYDNLNCRNIFSALIIYRYGKD